MSYPFKIKKKKIMFNKNMLLLSNKIPKNPILPTKFNGLDKFSRGSNSFICPVSFCVGEMGLRLRCGLLKH